MTEAIATSYVALEIVQDADLRGKRVITTLSVSAGDVIAQIIGHREVPVPNRFSVQVGTDRHIDGLRELTYLNHSCAPNVFVNTTELTVIALRPIAMGEELSFFYPSTEWRMAEPFDCLCGTTECVGQIAGAEPLSQITLSRFRINDHILALHRVAHQWQSGMPVSV